MRGVGQLLVSLLGEIIGGLGKGQAVGTQDLPEFAIRFCAGKELQGTVPGHIAVGKRAGLSQKVAMGFIGWGKDTRDFSHGRNCPFTFFL